MHELLSSTACGVKGGHARGSAGNNRRLKLPAYRRVAVRWSGENWVNDRDKTESRQSVTLCPQQVTEWCATEPSGQCHVWTAPALQEESDVSAKRSGAAMYSAFGCSRYGRWP